MLCGQGRLLSAPYEESRPVRLPAGGRPALIQIDKWRQTLPKFLLQAKVDQIVTKDVSLQVEAVDEEEAVLKAREALQTFPDAIRVEGVQRVLASKSNYWIPRDIQIKSIKQEEKNIA